VEKCNILITHIRTGMEIVCLNKELSLSKNFSSDLSLAFKPFVSWCYVRSLLFLPDIAPPSFLVCFRSSAASTSWSMFSSLSYVEPSYMCCTLLLTSLRLASLHHHGTLGWACASILCLVCGGSDFVICSWFWVVMGRYSDGMFRLDVVRLRRWWWWCVRWRCVVVVLCGAVCGSFPATEGVSCWYVSGGV